MYRTGDLGCLLPDGQIAFRGRTDQQEKIRGHRIELDEIVSVLDQYLGVSSSAVLARPDSSGEKRLLAYVIPAHDALISSTDLHQFLAAAAARIHGSLEFSFE